jgi:hypothetical protein
MEKIITLEEENHGRFVEFPPARSALVVDESGRIRHLEVSIGRQAGRWTAALIKTARYSDDLHGEKQLL